MTGLSLEIPLVAFSIIMHAIAGRCRPSMTRVGGGTISPPLIHLCAMRVQGHRLEAHVQETGGALFLSEGLVAVFFGA